MLSSRVKEDLLFHSLLVRQEASGDDMPLAIISE